MAKKKVTLAEFHAWLEGVEEMHADDWCPDANQWKVIRNKIKTIEAVPSPVSNVVIPAGPLPRTPAEQFAQAGFTPAPEAPSSIPMGPIEKPSAMASSLLTGDGQKTVTPTSETGDASPFS